VHDRLVNAADGALRAGGPDAVTIEAVAAAAGVSRATAFRQLGKREDMIVAVGLLRAERYARACADEVATKETAFDQLQSAFEFVINELPGDPVMRALTNVRTIADLADDIHELVTETFGPVVELGRASGQIRVDVSTEQVVRWVVEQLYLAIQDRDRSVDAVRDRLSTFVFPALAPGSASHSSSAAALTQVDRLSMALGDAVRTVAALRGELAQ